jgi:hypothetical protein
MAARRNPFKMEVFLPERGPARWGVIAALVVGGLVALLVPVVLALVIWGAWQGP